LIIPFARPLLPILPAALALRKLLLVLLVQQPGTKEKSGNSMENVPKSVENSWNIYGKTMENIGKRCCNHWKTRIEDSNGLGSRGKCARKNLGKIRILQIAAHSVAEQFKNWGANWARSTCLNHPHPKSKINISSS